MKHAFQNLWNAFDKSSWQSTCCQNTDEILCWNTEMQRKLVIDTQGMAEIKILGCRNGKKCFVSLSLSTQWLRDTESMKFGQHYKWWDVAFWLFKFISGLKKGN